MKSQISPKPKEQVKYPCLMKSLISGNILLFIANRTGYVVYIDPRSSANFWQYSNDWDMNNFEPYSGDVILSND